MSFTQKTTEICLKIPLFEISLITEVKEAVFMVDYDLDAAIKAEHEVKIQRKKRKTVLDEILINFDKIEHYRKKDYSLGVIHSGFKRLGLLNCSFDHFKNCYYQIKKTRASLGLIDSNPVDLKRIRTEESFRSKESDLSASRQTNESSKVSFDSKAALESIFGPSKQAPESEAEDGGDISSSSVRPSILTEEMAARMERDKKLFKERLRSMGIHRD